MAVPAAHSGGARLALWTLGAVCAATFMLLLAITIVAVALRDIARDLRTSGSRQRSSPPATPQWPGPIGL
jgi:hypothetical protein